MTYAGIVFVGFVVLLIQGFFHFLIIDWITCLVTLHLSRSQAVDKSSSERAVFFCSLHDVIV